MLRAFGLNYPPQNNDLIYESYPAYFFFGVQEQSDISRYLMDIPCSRKQKASIM